LRSETEDDIKSKLPHVEIKQAYGMTEFSPVTHIAPKATIVPGSVGKLIPNMLAKIVNHDSGKEVGVGETGELWLKGPNEMRGYLNNPSATAATIDKDGFYHTGDVVYVDADGNYFVVDRVKELIKYKGLQIAPAELEGLLLSHPDVIDVAVAGKPDLEGGEVPVAFIVRRHKDVTEKDIAAWVEKKVAPHKKLRGGVIFVEAVPKTPSGKIVRRALKARL